MIIVLQIYLAAGLIFVKHFLADGPSPLLYDPSRRDSSVVTASWRSGYAEDCKSLHPSSILGEASKFFIMISNIYLRS